MIYFVDDSFGSEQAPTVFIDGNYLYERCVSAEAHDASYCLAYVLGASDAIAVESVAKPYVCIPDRVTAGQLKSVIIKYLSDNPKDRHMVASLSISKALWSAFPCE
jgi:hypothetical protein